MQIPDFDDLEDDVRIEYILEAYEQLDSDNMIPHEVITGDSSTVYEYDPVIDLARRNYESSFEDD